MTTPTELTNDPHRRRKLLEKAKLPMLSGKATALVIVLLLLLTAILVPMASRLPVWIEAEIVLAAWWLIWIGVLTYLLYYGHRLSHDHELGEPRNWFSALTSSAWDNPWGIGRRRPQPRAEGCANVIAVFLVSAIALGLVWLIVEVAIPTFVFLLYLLVRGMLAHIANDNHECEGRVGRSMFWAVVWATLYTVPLGLLVCFVHWIMAGDQA